MEGKIDLGEALSTTDKGSGQGLQHKDKGQGLQHKDKGSGQGKGSGLGPVVRFLSDLRHRDYYRAIAQVRGSGASR